MRPLFSGYFILSEEQPCISNVGIMGATFFQILAEMGNGTWCVTGIMCQGPEVERGMVLSG